MRDPYNKKEEIKKMIAAPVKPIKPMEIEFDSQKEMDNFIEYAIQKEKTHDKDMEIMREIFKQHIQNRNKRG
jgi:hypothetical protein